MKKIIVLLLVFSFFFAAKGGCNPFEANLKINQEASLHNDNLKKAAKMRKGKQRS